MSEETYEPRLVTQDHPGDTEKTKTVETTTTVVSSAPEAQDDMCPLIALFREAVAQNMDVTYVTIKRGNKRS